jgi:hypothetical protein
MPSIINATTTTGVAITGDNSGNLALQTAGNTAVTVTTGQNVGIGTSSPVSGRALTLNSTSNYFGLVLQTSGTTRGQIIQESTGNIYVDAGSDGGSGALILRTTSIERMRIDSSGGLILAGSTAQKATGTTWSNPSDIRLKDNIQEYTKGLPELMQVNVKTWEYNGKGGTVQGTKGLGVIADEIKKILPDTVDDYKAKLNEDDAEDSDIKKFDATEITWLMLKSIQELNAKVDAQAVRIAELEGAK